MSGKLDIRAYVNPDTPGETESGQTEGITPGAEIYVENRRGTVIAALIKSVRKGTIVEVKELHCLAPTDFRADKRRRLMAERVEAIKAAGGCIREWATGYMSKGRLPTMMLQAYEQIATSGKGRRRDKTGRPPKWMLTPAEREIALGIWRSRRYTNGPDRTTAINKRLKKKISESWLRLEFKSPHKRPNKN